MRIILYTGKGGVGKTSISAASALRSAELGYKTIVMSTDIAHSLADCLDMPLGSEPMKVAPNLWGQEIDTLKEVEANWSTVRDWLAALMQWQGVDQVVAEEMAVLPGMDELVGLLYIARYYQEGNYDVMVVDCAPTGETLRLLSFPEMARWYMDRLFPIGRKATAALAPLARTIIGMPMPGSGVFDSIQGLYTQLNSMRQILINGDVASVRLVVNAEKMVIKEAQRTFTYLNLYGYHTDAVVCNRLLPDRVGDSFFDAWRESQRRYLQFLKECFNPLPVITAPLMEREVVGLDVLRKLAEETFGNQDPTQILYHGATQQIRREGRNHILELKVPFVTKEDISLVRNGDELVLQAGPYRRNVLLPQVLMPLEVKEAKLKDGSLHVLFEDRRPSARKRNGPKGSGTHSR
ncbi:MAG: ArsA family ATPase [Chloroflexi bacterium]|nr:ArsA family ATPase [Chloroflexota bacterium]